MATATRVPSIPNVSQPGVLPWLQYYLDVVKEIIEIREGIRGKSSIDRFVKLGELADLISSEYASLSSGAGYYEVVTHAGNHTVLYSDLNKIHLYTAAATITLPAMRAEDIGKWMDLRKRTTGNITINWSVSDYIIDAGTTSLTNTNAAENFAVIRLDVEVTNAWGIGYQLGTWS